MRPSNISLLLGLLAAAPAAAQQPLVVRLEVHGTIENGLAPYVERGVREAEARHAAAILVDLDTPGGRIDAAERMTDALRSASMPVVAFVHPRAFSAGAMIALSADGIVMAPAGVIGAATPVDGEGHRASEKIVSAMRGEFRALAEARGLDPRLAEAMVDETLDVPGIKPRGRLLVLSADEAVRHGVATQVGTSDAEALGAIGVTNARVETLTANWAESLVRFLTNPLVAPLLLSVGMLGLLFEIKAGAFGAGFVVSLLALGAFFGANALVGLAGFEELLVLGAGVVALGIEVFVLPGFGIAGVAGIGLILASAVMAMLGASPTSRELAQALAVLGAAILATLIVAFAWLRHLPYSTRFGGLMFKEGQSREDGFASAVTRDDLVGQAGVAQTDLRPAGVAVVADERLGRGDRGRIRGARCGDRGGALGWLSAHRTGDLTPRVRLDQSATTTSGVPDVENDTGMGVLLGTYFFLFIVAIVAATIFLRFIPIGLWIRAAASGVRVPFITLFGMRLRRVNPALIVDPLITSSKAGLSLNIRDLEGHFLSGGNVQRVVNAMISADKAGIPLGFKQATAIDLAGRDVFEAVQVSVNPKVITTPKVAAMAKDGIQLLAIARVTVRANVDRLVGGAGEETILARVGEGIVSTIGSATSHKAVLENPDMISKTVLAKGLDAGTAFEILSIDIADVDVGKNIGAELQTDQAEADKRIAQAKAEERRALAVAMEQEFKAEAGRQRAKVIEAEAEIPRAIADSFRKGGLGVMDYQKYLNLEADTQMRRSIAEGGDLPGSTPVK